MLLLLDECVPRPLIHDLIGHDVRHVVDMGWSSKRNGELLQLMIAAQFAALLTVDQNLEFQQNVGGAGSWVIVLIAKTNRIQELRPLVTRFLEAIPRFAPGELTRIAA